MEFSVEENEYIETVTAILNKCGLEGDNNSSYLTVELRDNSSGSKIGSWNPENYHGVGWEWEFRSVDAVGICAGKAELLRFLAEEAKMRGDIGKDGVGGVSASEWLKGYARRIEREGNV